MFSMVSLGANELTPAMEGAGIKLAKAMKGLPNQLSPN